MPDTQRLDSASDLKATRIDEIESFIGNDLAELCELTTHVVTDGDGFLWVKAPPIRVLENYWNGVMLVPERSLFIARLDGRVVGTAQLLRPPANNESGSFAAQITTFIIAPWARGHGLARGLLQELEEVARARGYSTLDLDVRSDRLVAIKLFEAHGFVRWGVKQRYARINGRYIAGYYYSKHLDESAASK
ncbi:MAG: GNAT family N-acetyltransferase [Alphaproteobacteria bacterium]|nr:GNAT family N-acetyltransferase [Alphaproteobacteria bacterium]